MARQKSKDAIETARFLKKLVEAQAIALVDADEKISFLSRTEKLWLCISIALELENFKVGKR